MIPSMHAVIYWRGDRAFFREVLGCSWVDASGANRESEKTS
jgi:hypothetical protein